MTSSTIVVRSGTDGTDSTDKTFNPRKTQSLRVSPLVRRCPLKYLNQFVIADPIPQWQIETIFLLSRPQSHSQLLRCLIFLPVPPAWSAPHASNLPTASKYIVLAAADIATAISRPPNSKSKPKPLCPLILILCHTKQVPVGETSIDYLSFIPPQFRRIRT
jgi:hypothetical protein